LFTLEVALGHTENAGQMREYSAFRQQIYKLKQIARNFGMDLKYYSTEKVLGYYLKNTNIINKYCSKAWGQ